MRCSPLVRITKSGSETTRPIEWARFSCTAPTQRNDPQITITDCLYLGAPPPKDAGRLKKKRLSTVTIPIEAKVVRHCWPGLRRPFGGRHGTILGQVFLGLKTRQGRDRRATRQSRPLSCRAPDRVWYFNASEHGLTTESAAYGLLAPRPRSMTVGLPFFVLRWLGSHRHQNR